VNALLKSTPDCPKNLYFKGDRSAFKLPAVAIVGTRTPSKYGRETAYKFSFELAKKGLLIVSGLARGIDTVVHEAALDAKGKTVAVLGNGIDIIYPPENRKLSEKIIKSGGLLSEYDFNSKPLPKNFLARNRIIAGLSVGIVVIEGRRRSGTLSTARWAADYGREVFAVPGRIDSPLSEATHYLIENGANIARTPEDIVVQLSLL